MIAFFDLDYTLLDTSSGLMYVREAIKQRRLSLMATCYVGILHQFNLIDFGQAHARLIRLVGRHGFTETSPFFERLVSEKLFSHITPTGRAKIRWHQQQGHRVIIVSASITEIVKPIARHLGLGEDYLCTRLVVKNNQYTGQLDGATCHGAGKVDWVKRWCGDNGLDFSDVIKTSYFYTDSSADQPLLELVKHPVAVNPSRKLAKIALKRGWPVERFY
jgi:putative phosphoserine phosphatase/1-acylglycerol-3-phosphate O-acyltransferase